MSNEPEIQRWTAKRKAELVKEIIKGKTNIAEAARTHDLTPAEDALLNRYGTLGQATTGLTLRSDNGLVFTSRLYTTMAYQYGLTQEFIRPHTPQQNGMVERLIRTVKEQCLWLHNFESLSAARVALSRWFQFYNHERPHQALKMKPPAEVYALAA